MTPKAQIRDILAIPVTLVGIVCMFATLPLFALAATIGGYCLMCAAVNALKGERNAVLSEVEREVESKRITADEIYNNGGTDGYGEYAQGNNLMIQKVSTIINNLRVK